MVAAANGVGGDGLRSAREGREAERERELPGLTWLAQFPSRPSPPPLLLCRLPPRQKDADTATPPCAPPPPCSGHLLLPPQALW